MYFSDENKHCSAGICVSAPLSFLSFVFLEITSSCQACVRESCHVPFTCILLCSETYDIIHIIRNLITNVSNRSSYIILPPVSTECRANGFVLHVQSYIINLNNFIHLARHCFVFVLMQHSSIQLFFLINKTILVFFLKDA